jgi:GPH family glycoside/pentoside/hexuronide:cation symporter
MVSEDRLPTRLKLIHGFGSIAYGIKDNGFSVFLLIYYNQVIGLDSGLVSMALMIALILDAFIDPFIGHLSDRTYTRFGRRLPWLYLAPIPLAFTWMLLWAPPIGLSDGQLVIYLVLVTILIRTLISCCEVPSQSLVPELTRDYDERTSVMRYRFLFGWGGGLLTLYLAYTAFLVPDAQHAVGLLNPDGYWTYGIFTAILMSSAVIISAAGQHSRITGYPTKRPEKHVKGQALLEIRESLSHRAFLILIGAGVFAHTSQGLTFSISNYLFAYVWQFGDAELQFYPIVLFASAVLAFLFVSPLGKAFGKRRTAIVCGIIALLCWVMPFALRLMDLWPEIGSAESMAGVYVFAALSTALSITVMITAASMIADIVEASEVETGRRTEGLFYAGNMFMQKCATGFGIGISGVIIAWAGLSEKTDPALVDPLVLDRLTIAYCAIIIVSTIASSFIFSRFPIGRKDHAERLALLAATK